MSYSFRIRSLGRVWVVIFSIEWVNCNECFIQHRAELHNWVERVHSVGGAREMVLYFLYQCGS